MQLSTTPRAVNEVDCRLDGTLRMKANMLDSPGLMGGVFYGKTDTKAFVALVKGLLTP